MKAVMASRYGGPEVLEYQDTGDLSPGETEVLIQVEAAGVNFADILGRKGIYRRKQPPFIPGNEAAGIVAALGAGVKDFRIGQRVICFPKSGAYAEYTLADQHLTYPISDNVGWMDAAAIPVVGCTALQLLSDKGRLQSGETVLVHAAAGGLGTTAVQIARILGASTIIGTVGSEEKMTVAYETGCDFVINYRQQDFTSAVLELTKGKGADVILDPVSGEVTGKSVQCLAYNGRLMLYGKASGDEGTIRIDDLQPNNQSIMGYSLSKTRSMQPEWIRESVRRVLGFLDSGKLSMRIGGIIPLSEAAGAHKRIESRMSTGKLLLLPPQSNITLPR